MGMEYLSTINLPRTIRALNNLRILLVMKIPGGMPDQVKNLSSTQFVGLLMI